MVKKVKKPYEQWWFWAGAMSLIVISLLAGVQSSGDSPDPIAVEEEEETSPELSIESMRDWMESMTFQDSLETDPWFLSGGASQGLSKVMKRLPNGLVKRLNERHRQLYVNDPVWRVISYERKEHTARLVGEYLDWVHETSSGMVDVRSFRNGRRVAMVNSMGSFQVYNP